MPRPKKCRKVCCMPTSTEFVPVGASVQPVDAVTMTVANPGHKPGFLPNFLGDMGVEVIIAGGMGGGAVEIFNERNIEVIVGAQGDARSAVESYLHGELKSTGSICHEHEHAGECGEHQ